MSVTYARGLIRLLNSTKTRPIAARRRDRRTVSIIRIIHIGTKFSAVDTSTDARTRLTIVRNLITFKPPEGFYPKTS